MHHIVDIANICDEIAPRELYLAVAYLSGSITLEQAVAASHSYREYFLEQIEKMKRVAMMMVENDTGIRRPWMSEKETS